MVLHDLIAVKIKDVLKKNPQGMNITQMFRVMDINRNTLSRYLETLLVSGQVEMRRLGMGKIYTLSERVPLSEVLSISSELVIQLDKSLRITFANEPFLHLIGTERKHLIRKNIEYTPVALVFDASFPLFMENIRKGIAGEKWAGEISLSSKDIVVFCRIIPTVFDDGQRGVSVILEDITHHKKADKDLQESEDRYRKLVEISPDAVFIHQEGKIIYANPATFRLLGALHQHEILGKNVLDFVQTKFRDSVRNNIINDISGDTTPPMELHMSRVNGTPVIVEGRGVRTFIDGEFAIQVALRDITERKRAEEVLRTKDRQLSSIFSNVPDVLFYLSVETYGRYRFLTVNQSFLNKVHLTEDQVVGKYVHDVIPGPLYTRASEKYLQAIIEKKTIKWEEVQDSPYGKRYGDCTITAMYDENGHATNIIGSVHDSTSHKQLEEELRKSEGKLTAMLESMSDIISMVDRDLNILWVNELTKRDFGSDIIGKKCYEVYHQRKTPCDSYSCSVIHTFRDGKMHQNEITLIDKTGKIRVFEGSANVALRDETGIPVAVLETAREITDKKNAEEALRESEATARALINAPTDSVILMDNHGNILALNDTAASRFGRRPEELIGVLTDDLLPNDVAQTRRLLVSRIFETKTMVRFEDERDGRRFDTVAYPILNEHGDVTRIAIVARDITKQE